MTVVNIFLRQINLPVDLTYTKLLFQYCIFLKLQHCSECLSLVLMLSRELTYQSPYWLFSQMDILYGWNGDTTGRMI